jgi:pilus assembly protein Flp/PilA
VKPPILLKRRIIVKKSSRNKKQKGQGLVEYALILVLVAVVVIAVLLVMGPTIGNIFTKINSGVANQTGGGGGGNPPPAGLTFPCPLNQQYFTFVNGSAGGNGGCSVASQQYTLTYDVFTIHGSNVTINDSSGNTLASGVVP